jgi:starch phosphorylase
MSGSGTRVAYFTMEIALAPDVPTYAGGLGVLAGDTIRSAADLGLPLAAVSLLHRQGFFQQRLDETGGQTEHADRWQVDQFAVPLAPRVELTLAGRIVHVRAWVFPVRGLHGAEVPVYLLDTDLPENADSDRALTGSLYGGDHRYRLSQEIVLGLGGLRMLRALGHRRIHRFHLNEGHAALVALGLLEETRAEAGSVEPDPKAVLEKVRERCVFTTHTPVPAGHDIFSAQLVRDLLGEGRAAALAELGQHDALNLTDLALRTARFVNGVAMRHGEVSRNMYPDYPIRSITNGIHPPTWATPSFAKLFDHHVPQWRQDPLSLRHAVKIPLPELRSAHQHAKHALLERIRGENDTSFVDDALTIGFARRATAYKRATLIFSDIERLAALAANRGPIQLVLAGKAHPRDDEGKARIREVFAAREALRGRVAIAYLANYDMELGRLLCGGCDVWLNTPIPPLEASGTSGMKAALNGVPSLSILDGWWLEGHVEGITGWAIGSDPGPGGPTHATHETDAAALYEKLESAILPRFFGDPDAFLEIRRSAITLNASFFNTQRMLLEYLFQAYSDPGAMLASADS